MLVGNKRLFGIILTVTLLLFIPFIAMQFTDEVNWTIGDFVVAAGLLLGAGLFIELVLRKVKKSKYKVVIILATFTVLILVWIELAVGIFGTPLAGS